MSDDNSGNLSSTDTSLNEPAAVGDGLTHPVCRHCGSQQVAHDAWANWDPEERAWKVQQVFDQAFCFDCEGETKLRWAPGPSDLTTRLRDLNDALRHNRGATGKFVWTSGLAEKGSSFVLAAAAAVASFEAFDADNDPHGEHDFGALMVLGTELASCLPKCDKITSKIG